ncbi:MAG: transposase, partial [Anaerolineae bacterium]
MSHKPRSQDTGKCSFFGDLVYKRIVPQDHFLVALNNLFDWDALSARLLKAYRDGGVWGRPPYDPGQMFKILFISYLHGVSEREVEQLVNFHLVVKWFVGLAVDEAAPDHSSLTIFKNRYLKPGEREHLSTCFDQVIAQALDQGVQLGNRQILDSVHTQANVNAGKDEEDQAAGKPPHDPKAKVINKGRCEVVEPDGRRRKKRIRYSEYKTQVSVNAETGIVTNLKVTRGNAPDNKQFPDLHAHDQTLGLPIRAYDGNRAYDDTDTYERLRIKRQ